MTRWQQLAGHLTRSAVSLSVITGIGGLAGAVGGTLLELGLRALLDLALPPVAVVASGGLLGLVLSLGWGIALLVHYWPRPTAA